MDIECIVIGAGVVGLAVARALALDGREVLVLEAAGEIGTSTSSRNSEVIHAGIYYRPGSLKARLCVRGRDQLYAYCASHGVDHQRCGKLIVARDSSQAEQLRAIAAHAALNGVVLNALSDAQARALEPELSCVAALHSPLTGIIDSHGLMLNLQGAAETRGAAFAFHSPVHRFKRDKAGGWCVEVGGDEPMALRCRWLINAAGHGSPALMQRCTDLDPKRVPTARMARGHYFNLSEPAPFRHLIYPVPEPGGLGIHLTMDLAGRARFGPDVEWVDVLDYRVDPALQTRFETAIRDYWPALPRDALQPGYAGIRPKLELNGQLLDDFWIEGPAEHGLEGLVLLAGIESPGLSSCLALADLTIHLLYGRPTSIWPPEVQSTVPEV